MKFGKYKELTVQQVLDFNHTRYLRWCYYCNSNISFTDDILEEIKIIYHGDKKTYDRTIEKPGKDEEAHESLNRYMSFAGDDMQRIKQWARGKKLKKHEYNRNYHSNKYKLRKGNLMSKNHGH